MFQKLYLNYIKVHLIQNEKIPATRTYIYVTTTEGDVKYISKLN